MGGVREGAVRVSKGGRELSRKEARVPIRWKAPRPYRGRRSSRDGVQRRSQAGCRSDGCLQPRRRGPVGNAGAREERRGGESANAGPLLGPLGPRGLRCASSLSGSSAARRSRGRYRAPRGSLPVVWVTSRHGNAKRPKAVFAGEDEPYARRVRASSSIAEIGGRRRGSEKRRRTASLTRRSVDCVAGSLGRRGQASLGETWGVALGERTDVEIRTAAAKSRDR